jgi:drug/metabolite transporter (DMT)-like permease
VRRPVSVIVDATVALALFGCIPVVVKYTSANPWTIGIFRLAIATAVMAALTAARGQLRRVTARELSTLVAIGALFFGHWATYFLSIKMSSASIAAIGLSTYGVDLMVIGALAGHHRIRAVEVVALILAVGGAVIVVPDFRLGSGALAGMALALASAFCYAILPILHQRASHIPNALRTLGQFGFALVCFLLFLPKANWSLERRDWLALLFLAIGATLIAHTLWVRVTTQLSPATASVIYYGNVPFAVLLSVVILHDPVTWRTFTGAGLIIAGTLIGLAPQLRAREGAGW